MKIIPLQNVKQLIFADPRAAELIIAAFWIAFGIVLVYPTESYLSSPVYRLMALFMPENVAGTLFILVGLVGFLSLISLNVKARRLCMFISFLLWLGIVVSFVISAFNTSSTYVVLSAASLWAYLRLGYE